MDRGPYRGNVYPFILFNMTKKISSHGKRNNYKTIQNLDPVINIKMVQLGRFLIDRM